MLSVPVTWAHSSSFFLRSRSLSSSLETGLQRDSASALIRGANDSIACLFAFIRQGVCENRGQVLPGSEPYLVVF